MNGDVLKLQYADNLTSTEKVLLGCYGKATKTLSGTQQIRRKIGHCIFGASVSFGEGLFVTISPNRRHSCLVLRLARARQNDTALQSNQRKRHPVSGEMHPTQQMQTHCACARQCGDDTKQNFTTFAPRNIHKKIPCAVVPNGSAKICRSKRYQITPVSSWKSRKPCVLRTF